MENDVLMYLDNRFESIKKHQDEVNNKIFEKLNEIHTQTIKTNGRVNVLDKMHENCKGQQAYTIAKDLETKGIVEKTKEFKLGSLLLTSSVAAGIVLGFLGIYKYLL